MAVVAFPLYHRTPTPLALARASRPLPQGERGGC
jgi:hypothetical protein